MAETIGNKPGFHVALLHLELPPRMLEWGGSEDPQIEHRVADQRESDYRELEHRTVEQGRMLLSQMKQSLVKQGIDVAALFVKLDGSLKPTQLAEDILKVAKEKDYRTIVVGRETFSGLRRLFQHHVAEELVRSGEGRTIWIVE